MVFCRSISSCTTLYKYFATSLKGKSYNPIGSAPTTENRLFAMYHARIDENDKRAILKSLTTSGGSCRVIFCTTAFGMGVDIHDISVVIHYGPSSDIEDYLQESGRAGRDGCDCHAVLYVYPTCTVGHVSPAMKEYCQQTTPCQRNVLLGHFGFTAQTQLVIHKCCDIRHKTCIYLFCSLPIETFSC